MEREVSASVWIGITLLLLSALMGIIFGTIVLGQSIENRSGSALTSMSSGMSVDYVRSLSAGDVNSDMPAATAYNILTSYKSIIIYEASGYDATVRNLETQGSVLSQHLQGRVNLDVVKTKDGDYVAFVHILNNQGQVQDLTTTGFKKLASMYGLSSWG